MKHYHLSNFMTCGGRIATLINLSHSRRGYSNLSTIIVPRKSFEVRRVGFPDSSLKKISQSPKSDFTHHFTHHHQHHHPFIFSVEAPLDVAPAPLVVPATSALAADPRWRAGVARRFPRSVPAAGPQVFKGFIYLVLCSEVTGRMVGVQWLQELIQQCKQRGVYLKCTSILYYACAWRRRFWLKNSRVKLFQQFSFNESVSMKQIHVDINGWLLHLGSALIKSKTYVYLFMIFWAWLQGTCI